MRHYWCFVVYVLMAILFVFASRGVWFLERNATITHGTALAICCLISLLCGHSLVMAARLLIRTWYDEE